MSEKSKKPKGGKKAEEKVENNKETSEKKDRIIVLIACSDKKRITWQIRGKVIQNENGIIRIKVEKEEDQKYYGAVDISVLKAREKYDSDFFKASLNFAEAVTNADNIFILSSRYILLRPDTPIRGYNETVKWKTEDEKKAWADEVLERLDFELKSILTVWDTVLLLTNEEKTDCIEKALKIKGINVITPLRHKYPNQYKALLEKSINSVNNNSASMIKFLKELENSPSQIDRIIQKIKDLANTHTEHILTIKEILERINGPDDKVVRNTLRTALEKLCVENHINRAGSARPIRYNLTPLTTPQQSLDAPESNQ